MWPTFGASGRIPSALRADASCLTPAVSQPGPPAPSAERSNDRAWLHCIVRPLQSFDTVKTIPEIPYELATAELAYENAVRAMRRADATSEFLLAEARMQEARRRMYEIADAVAHGRHVPNTKI